MKGTAIRTLFNFANKKFHKEIDLSYGLVKQKEVLKGLLRDASSTEFGVAYKFKDLKNEFDPYQLFSSTIPIHTYETMWEKWWHKIERNEKNITWPGKLNFIALTSGTTNASSKKIPISKQMVSSVRKTGFSHLCTLANYGFDSKFYESEILFLGGSTSLTSRNNLREGDLSGIMTANLPKWLKRNYRPGVNISAETQWDSRTKQIVKSAQDWNIGVIAGVPSWIISVIEEIIKTHNVESIYDLWPNLKVIAHGGVCISPYKSTLKRMLGEQIVFSETYLASEGFMGYQISSEGTLTLAVDSGVYFEFIPFDERNFSCGLPKDSCDIINLSSIKENREYAVLISTNSGAWRYLIGDTVRFTNLKNLEFKISGRTSQFVNTCGEHLSIEQLTQAVNYGCKKLNVESSEFGFYPIVLQGDVIHNWFIGSTVDFNEAEMKTLIDNQLKVLNDDYKSLRHIKVKDIVIKRLPNNIFYDWMDHHGKLGGQNKFPRIMNKTQYDSWLNFLIINRL